MSEPYTPDPALVDRFQTHLAPLKEAIAAFPWGDARAYADWVAQSYYYVRHTTPLICAALARLPQEGPIARRLLENLREEIGHDNLLLRDLKALGASLDDHPEDAIVRAFYQGGYYLIEHRDPTAIMGRALALEGFAAECGPAIVEAIFEAHGRGAGNFWRVHAEEDISHVQGAYRAVASLTPEQRAIALQELGDTLEIYELMLSRIVARRG